MLTCFCSLLASPNIHQLDGRHVVFGKVLEGEDVVKRVEGVGSNSGATTKTVTIVDSGEL